MVKPEMPNMAGMGAMTDAFDFMKKMWGGMGTPPAGLPGMVMPTLSVEEINKQIADLKAVESWLNVNMSMLRGTIQALEVQSATISSLQAMSQSFGAAMTPEPARAERRDKSDAGGHSSDESREAQPSPASRPKKETPSRSPRNSRTPAKETPAPQASAPQQSPLADPAAWWSMLQNQFNQAVGSAIAEPAEQQPAPAAPPRKRKTSARRAG